MKRQIYLIPFRKNNRLFDSIFKAMKILYTTKKSLKKWTYFFFWCKCYPFFSFYFFLLVLLKRWVTISLAISTIFNYMTKLKNWEFYFKKLFKKSFGNNCFCWFCHCFSNTFNFVTLFWWKWFNPKWYFFIWIFLVIIFENWFHFFKSSISSII